ncbi:MAG: S8 family serine peptidase [FCB group bacterium]|nr:S8 family serine peptidase [FCB group bacterium]
MKKSAQRFALTLSFVLLLIPTAQSIVNSSSYPTAAVSSDRLFPRQPAVKPLTTIISPNAEIERVIVKLEEGTRARLDGSSIASATDVDLSTVNSVIRSHSSDKLHRLAIKSPLKVEQEKFVLELNCGRQLADMNNYFYIKVNSPAEAEALVNQLNQLPEVEIAYAEPKATPAVDIDPPTGDFTAGQDYLRVAPGGVDADYANTLAGGDGSGVKIIDVEGGWKTDHEDLDAAVGGLLGGTMYEDIDWRNHGTAVIGEMIGSDNGYGITGIAPGAEIGMVAIGGIGTTQALLIAADSLEPGDVYLIELHAPGPRYDFESRDDQLGYVCMEYWQANFDAIQLAWAKGVIVCEAAGNGAEDFDDAIYENRFDTTYRNSHAIMCGAGAPPSGVFGTDRSRLDFSNFGERVNLQGYGRGVVTTGYGDYFAPNGDERQFYTQYFSGTSSASPIVTASVASLQGIYKARYSGAVLGPDDMRDVMVATGSPQQGYTPEHIGPRPNLAAAEAALTAPPLLETGPSYFDTTIEVNTQITVQCQLSNYSMTTTLEYSVLADDSLPSAGFARPAIGDWLTVTNPTGTIAPLSSVMLDIVLDATVIPDRSSVYKGLVDISYGAQGGPLDETAVVPVFLTVPCEDTTVTVTSSSDPEGPDYVWLDITGIGTEIASGEYYNSHVGVYFNDDGTAGPFALGFDFPFYDSTYDQVYIGVNGAMSFTDVDVNINGYYNGDLPIPGSPFGTLVSPFWTDLNLNQSIGGHGAIYYYQSPTNDSFVVEYYRMGNFNSSADTLTTFEVILQSNGNITFQYQSVGNTDLENGAVIGVAEIDCASEGYVIHGDPSENIVADNTTVFFDYYYTFIMQSGDVNEDDDINVGDVVFLINWIFKNGPDPYDLRVADTNCDGENNVGDAVLLINYVFKNGTAPCQYEL